MASGNALDIGRQYLMQGMSHTALEIWQTYIFHMFLFKRIQHLNRVGKCRGYGGYIRVNFLETWGKFFESYIRAYGAA